MIIRLLYDSSISDIEHSPNYISLGSPQTTKVNYRKPTLPNIYYIYIYI